MPWQAQGIAAADSHFSSLRLSYSIAQLGARLEFFRTEEGVEALLSSTSAPFQEMALTLYDEGEEPLRERVRPMEGNMRVRLSLAMVERLLASLTLGESVELEVGGLKTFIDAKGFVPLWEKKGEFLFHIRR
jgi:hypothetical protein